MSTACEYDAPSKNVLFLFLFSLGPTVAKRGIPASQEKSGKENYTITVAAGGTFSS